MKDTLRKKLVNAILNLAGDEFETKEELTKLAFKNNEELAEVLIDIADYYHEQNNL